MFKPVAERIQKQFKARAGVRQAHDREARGGACGGCNRAPIDGASERAERGPETHPPVEFVFVGPMALDLAIRLRAGTRNLAVVHADIPKVAGEVGPELRAMVRLDPLDGHWQAAV